MLCCGPHDLEVDGKIAMYEDMALALMLAQGTVGYRLVIESGNAMAASPMTWMLWMTASTVLRSREKVS